METRNSLFTIDAMLATLMFLKSSCGPSEKEKYQDLLNIFPNESDVTESSDDEPKVRINPDMNKNLKSK